MKTASIQVFPQKVCGEIDRRLFGHFTEHAFENIYKGIYDPKSPLADQDGMRADVLKLIEQVKPAVLRYPGGNFVSNYHWEDGVGPKETRKKVFEYAWLTEESNQFGTVEFIEYCRKVGAEPLLCVNMGSGTVEEAMHWVEYCNGTMDTYYANLRRSHGHEEPFNVKYWGLGNEMYGLWQMQNLPAEQYAEQAYQFAKAMKWVDPSIELIGCGLEYDAEWNHAVVKKLGGYIDYLSSHYYATGWGNFPEIDYMESLYIPVQLEERHQLTLAAIMTGLNGVNEKIKVVWNEWNLYGWRFDTVNDDSTYNLHDAIITALIFNTFFRNCETIKMANYSTFVNISGALSVKEGNVLKRSQYHVFDLLANNTGKHLLKIEVDCDTHVMSNLRDKIFGTTIGTGYDEAPSERTLAIPMIDAVASRSGDEVYISLINKDPENSCRVTIDLPGALSVEAREIFSDELTDANTVGDEEKVTIRSSSASQNAGQLVYEAKKHSINLLKVKLG